MKWFAFFMMKCVLLLACVAISWPSDRGSAEAADPPLATAEPAPLSPEQLAEAYRLYEQRRKVQQAAHLQVFQEEFEAAKKLNEKPCALR